MSDEAKKSAARFRTFAQDLDAERAKRDQNSKTETVVSKPVSLNHDQPVSKAEVKEEKSAPVIKVTEPKIEIKPLEPKAEVEKVVIKEPIKIPAFHELQKKVDLISANKEELAKPKKSEDKKPKPVITPIRTNIGFDATVITDTKSDRFKLIPSLIESFKNWLISIKPKKKTLPPPKYTVPETSHRKGVIQKATSKTGAAFSADNETLKEQIRLRQLHEVVEEDKVEAVAENKPVEEPELESSWSPYTETGYNLLESPKKVPDVTQNVVLEYKKITKPEPVIEPIEPTVAEEELPEPTETLIEADIFDGRWSGDNEKIEIEPVTETPAEAPVVINLETEEELPELAKSAPGIKNELLNFKTNTLTITVLIIVIGVLIVFFTAKVIFNQLNSNQEEFIVTEAKPILANSTISSVLLLSSNINDIPKLIASAIAAAPMGLVELPITSQTGEEITPAYAFNLLKFQAKPTLKQSLTTARFVSFNHSKPVLVLKFVDKNTVRGGLLNWEVTLFNDLNILYQNQAPQNLEFTDETINNLDVRVLKGENGTLVVYGFINDDTVIISPEVFSFEELANQLHNK